MSASRVRSRLRKLRQQENKVFLTGDQKKEFPRAAQQFIIFGRPRRHGEGYAIPFEKFVERFPAETQQTPPEPRRNGLRQYIRETLANAKAKLARRKANKRSRQQRRAKAASPV